jgi:hypothetical protein
MTLPPVLDVEIAAQLLRCEPSTVRERLRQGDLMRARAGGNHTMAERQKGWDMERVELLRKIRRMGVQP